MKIEILGTRGEIEPSSPYHSHHSGMLLDDTFLFDCGDRSFLERHPTAIFLTHLHPDHAFFVRNPKKQPHLDRAVYAPEVFEDASFIEVLQEKKQIKGYEITPIPTHHSKKVKSQAYLINKDGEKILYTGDMIWINKEHHHLLDNLKLVITEASFIRQGGMIRKDKKTEQIYGHNGVPDLIRLFKRFTENILFVHFGSWFYKDIPEARKTLQKLAKEHDVHIHVGYDGMKLDVSELV